MPQLADAANKQINALQPKDAASLAKWREVVGGAVESIVGGSMPAKSDLEIKPNGEGRSWDVHAVRGATAIRPAARNCRWSCCSRKTGTGGPRFG